MFPAESDSFQRQDPTQDPRPSCVSLIFPREAHFKGGRLLDFLRTWELKGAPRGILQIIGGYTIPFVSKPPLVHFSVLTKISFETKGMESELTSLQEQGILETSTSTTGFLSRMFPVTKSDGSVRPIINLRGLNRYLSPKKFRLINHTKVLDFLQPRDYLLKLDISQAYFHIPVKPQHRRFLSVVHQGEILQFTCLPFGLSTAPLTFSKVTNWLASQLRNRGARVIVYLDDFLFAGQDPSQLEIIWHEAVHFLTELGWILNLEKSSKNPVTRLKFLGIVWDTVANLRSLPLEKITSIEKDLKIVFKHNSWNWEIAKRLLGKLNFAAFIVPLGRIHSRHLQRASNHLSQFQRKVVVPLPPSARKECTWWLQNLRNSSPIFACRKTIFLSTNASDLGWGAQLNGKHMQGLWNPKQKI
ncbi:uncharacterized protein LOC115887089 [Sitophilus oryzae]|uniref:Uncharacterized protein LOC115887089 n=1 Tax=Sitophilus oryzae TaxID=7048 RepID=A0A6J2YGN2_SITOR|nr:uncharacterized protein LOC115887089 [Sitophilus oryzae]